MELSEVNDDNILKKINLCLSLDEFKANFNILLKNKYQSLENTNTIDTIVKTIITG